MHRQSNSVGSWNNVRFARDTKATLKVTALSKQHLEKIKHQLPGLTKAATSGSCLLLEDYLQINT